MYLLPNLFSKFFSSNSINNLSINIMKIIGKIKVIKEPNKIDIPHKIKSIPKYMGLRLILNNPLFTSFNGLLYGFKVVFLFLNNIQARTSINKPAKIKIIPR